MAAEGLYRVSYVIAARRGARGTSVLALSQPAERGEQLSTALCRCEMVELVGVVNGV